MGRQLLGQSLLLLSGGMDSTALAWATKPTLAITIDYGQIAAAGEMRAATAICDVIGIRHLRQTVNCAELGSGDMAGLPPAEIAPVSEWWPFRNQLLITIAAAVAIREGLSQILVGSVANDSEHTDGTFQFFEAMGRLLKLQEGGLLVEVPAINKSTVELCRESGVPFEVLAWSHSCHISEYACGLCRGCTKHRESMRDLGYGEY